MTTATTTAPDPPAAPADIVEPGSARVALLRFWGIWAGVFLALFVVQATAGRFGEQRGMAWLWAMLVALTTPAALGAAGLAAAFTRGLDRPVAGRYLRLCKFLLAGDLALVIGVYLAAQVVPLPSGRVDEARVNLTPAEALRWFDPLVITAQLGVIALLSPLFPRPVRRASFPIPPDPPPADPGPGPGYVFGEVPAMTVEMPGNARVLKSLRAILESREAIGFVGAGASAGLYPLWGQLIRRLADEAVDRGVATETDRAYWIDAVGGPEDAAAAIKDRFKNAYGEALRAIFAPRAGADGRRHTTTHAALVRLPFRGLVTTNYDPGLLEARLALRPEVGATGFGTWRDADFVRRWDTGDLFREQALPVLHAHGIYDRSETVILGLDEYREAYKPGGYRTLIENLWTRGRLVFVGFSFSDTWLRYVADHVIARDLAGAAGDPRHVALIGLKPGELFTSAMRETFRRKYDAEVVFYQVRKTPTGGEDHSELEAILGGLAGTPSDRR